MAREEVGLTAQQVELSSDIDPVLLSDGLEIIREEKVMPFRQALKYHWRALLWSLALSFALVMDGYDGSIFTSFYAQPAFLSRFGTDFHNPKTGKTEKIIPGNWQTALSTILLPGNLLALWFVGWATDRIGNRLTYALGMALTICIIFMQVFCRSLPMLLVANLIMSFCWGIFHTMTAGYAAEICPIRLRGFATSFISLAWGSGGFIASGVLRGSLRISNDWGWRMPYMVQWVWPVPLLIIALLAPESPYWLVRKGKVEEAKASLRRTSGAGYWDDPSRNIDGYVAFLKHTDDLERAESTNASFLDMFRGTNLRRTEIMMCVWACQQFSGLSLSGFATTLFKNAGMSTVGAFNLNLVVTAMNIVGCAIELFIINRTGRRPLILAGLISLGTCLMLMGILGCVNRTPPVLRAIGAFVVMINLLYHITIGPATYTVAAELPSSRLRQRTIALGRAFYACAGAVVSQLTPRMIAPDVWNWGPKSGFFYLGTTCLCFIWVFFRMPETGGFSYAELDILFSNKVPARKFKKVRVRDEAAGDQVFDEAQGDEEEALDDKVDAHVHCVEVKP